MKDQFKANYLTCLRYMGWTNVREGRDIGNAPFWVGDNPNVPDPLRIGANAPPPNHNFCAEVAEKIEKHLGLGWVSFEYCYAMEEHQEEPFLTVGARNGGGDIVNFNMVFKAIYTSVETKLKILARIIRECGLVKEQS